MGNQTAFVGQGVASYCVWRIRGFEIIGNELFFPIHVKYNISSINRRLLWKKRVQENVQSSLFFIELFYGRRFDETEFDCNASVNVFYIC